MLMSKKAFYLATFASTLLVFSLHASQPATDLTELEIHTQAKLDRELARQHKQQHKERRLARKYLPEQYCYADDLLSVVQFAQYRQHKLYEREKRKVQRQLLAAVNTAVTTTLQKRGLNPDAVNVHVNFSYTQQQ